MTKNQDFGKLLKDIRIGKRLRQEDVEYLTGISVRSLSRLENGNIKSLGADSLILLSQAYEEDLLDIYYKNHFETDYLYEEILNKLGVASIFIERNEAEILSKKLSTVENDNKLMMGKEKNIKLLRLFMDRVLNKEFDKFDFKERYEEITSTIYNNSNIIDRKYSTIEMRILVNICNDFKEYKSFNNYEILEKIPKDCNNHTVKMLIFNSIINRLYVDFRSKEALSLINIAINEASLKKDVEALSLFYYDKFICEYDLGYNTYEESINLAKWSAKLSGFERLNEMIEFKSYNLMLD